MSLTKEERRLIHPAVHANMFGQFVKKADNQLQAVQNLMTPDYSIYEKVYEMPENEVRATLELYRVVLRGEIQKALAKKDAEDVKQSNERASLQAQLASLDSQVKVPNA